MDTRQDCMDAIQKKVEIIETKVEAVDSKVYKIETSILDIKKNTGNIEKISSSITEIKDNHLKHISDTVSFMNGKISWVVPIVTMDISITLATIAILVVILFYMMGG